MAGEMFSNLAQKTRRLIVSEEGPTTVEYAILLALFVGMMIASIIYVGNEASLISDVIVDEMDEALNKN